MKIKLAIFPIIIGFSFVILPGFSHIDAVAVEPPGSLEELLEAVRQEQTRERKINLERETRFMEARDRQAELLEEAKARLAGEEARSLSQKTQYEQNEKQISDFNQRLQKESGSLNELFGVVRQHIRETNVILKNSLFSSQKPGRYDLLQTVATQKKQPSIEEMEHFWLVMLEEMAASGKVVRFRTPVIGEDGETREGTVTRIGLFNVVSEGRYLRYFPETAQLAALARQPSGRFTSMIDELEATTTGIVPMGIDPSRGTILALRVESPDVIEKIQQGGIIGYVILAIGGIALLMIVERFVYLTVVGRRILIQIKEEIPKADNALGRIMRIYTEDPSQGIETLEHRLDEATLKELPRLERGLTTVAILAAIAPLLGLLGTVTGMIATFQSITLFGTGIRNSCRAAFPRRSSRPS
ncbi:MAG: MotA/TolQ/ExbB proton channel family protein [Nitrospiria bacterium]